MSTRQILKYLPAMVQRSLNYRGEDAFDLGRKSSDEAVLEELRRSRPRTPEWCSVISTRDQALLLIDPLDEDLDFEHCPDLQQCVNWAIKGNGNVILNLSQTPYLDSSGLGLILSLSKQVRTRFKLIMIAPKDQTVHNVLVLTRLESIFLRVETYEEALVALVHPAPTP